MRVLTSKVDEEQKLKEQCEIRALHYRNMARSYWERWQRELRQRKEALLLERQSVASTVHMTNVHEIDPTLLQHPVRGTVDEEIYVGQGSFGVVRLQFYRGIKVAVKEFQPRTCSSDVRSEANILARLCHPFLPFLFGICTISKPYLIVMQFHGIREGATSSLTVSQVIFKKKINDGYAWLGICAQLMEVVHYLHEEVGILHNDITASNILLTDSMTEKQDSYIQIVLIDFGKATPVANNRKYNLPVQKRVNTRLLWVVCTRDSRVITTIVHVYFNH